MDGVGEVGGWLRGVECAGGRCVDPDGSSVIMLTAGIDDAGGTFKPFRGAPVGTARKLGDDPKTGATTGGP